MRLWLTEKAKNSGRRGILQHIRIDKEEILTVSPTEGERETLLLSCGGCRWLCDGWPRLVVHLSAQSQGEHDSLSLLRQQKLLNWKVGQTRVCNIHFMVRKLQRYVELIHPLQSNRTEAKGNKFRCSEKAKKKKKLD